MTQDRKSLSGKEMSQFNGANGDGAASPMEVDWGYPECVKGPLKRDLCKGLDALGLRPSAHEVSILAMYLELLNKWNKVYNLTAIRDMNGMLVQHLFDCLAIIKPLRERCDVPAAAVLDVGSGAGLPAVVIATLQPQWQVTAVDAVGKKMAFVQQAAAALGIGNLKAVHSRVEAVQAQYDMVVSRAYASLPDFIGSTRHCLKASGVWCAMKGKEPADEMGLLPSDVEVFHVEQLAVPCMDAQRCLVWMRLK